MKPIVVYLEAMTPKKSLIFIHRRQNRIISYPPTMSPLRRQRFCGRCDCGGWLENVFESLCTVYSQKCYVQSQAYLKFIVVVEPLSCFTLWNTVGCSLLGSFLHGISQARIPGQAAIPLSRGPARPGVEPESPARRAGSVLLSHREAHLKCAWNSSLIQNDSYQFSYSIMTLYLLNRISHSGKLLLFMGLFYFKKQTSHLEVNLDSKLAHQVCQ